MQYSINRSRGSEDYSAITSHDGVEVACACSYHPRQSKSEIVKWPLKGYTTAYLAFQQQDLAICLFAEPNALCPQQRPYSFGFREDGNHINLVWLHIGDNLVCLLWLLLLARSLKEFP